MSSAALNGMQATPLGNVVRERLAHSGMTLPVPPAPIGAYRAVVARHGIAAVSGQFPLQDGSLRYPGVVGKDIDEETAKAATLLAALNVIAQIGSATDDFANFAGLLRLEGYVASSASFFGQPAVLNAASELFVQAFGEELGAHSRTAFAVSHLPLNAAVELAVTFALRGVIQTDVV